MFFILTFIYLIKTLQKYWHSWSAHCYVLVLCLYMKGEKEIIKILLSNLQSSCFKKWIIKTQGIKGGFVSRAGKEIFFKPKNLQQGLAMSLLASVSWSKWTLRCLFSQRTCTVKKKKNLKSMTAFNLPEIWETDTAYFVLVLYYPCSF